MQALHADGTCHPPRPRAPDPCARAAAQSHARRRGKCVGIGHRVLGYSARRVPHSAGGFEPADRVTQDGIDQPETGRRRGADEGRGPSDDGRHAVRSPETHGVEASGRATEEDRNRTQIVEAPVGRLAHVQSSGLPYTRHQCASGAAPTPPTNRARDVNARIRECATSATQNRSSSERWFPPYRGGSAQSSSRLQGAAPGVAEGVTGAADSGSPAYGVPAAVAPEGGSTS